MKETKKTKQSKNPEIRRYEEPKATEAEIKLDKLLEGIIMGGLLPRPDVHIYYQVDRTLKHSPYYAVYFKKGYCFFLDVHMAFIKYYEFFPIWEPMPGTLTIEKAIEMLEAEFTPEKVS